MQGVNAHTGKRLSGDAHLRQSVEDILMTPVGSRVLLRDYGSDIPSLVDNPNDDTQRVRIISAAAAALARWEPRLTLKRVSVSQQESQVILTLEGINNETGQAVRMEGVKVHGIP